MKKLILSFVLCAGLLFVHALEAARASAPIAQRIVTAAQVNGTWCNGHNEFRIWALGGQRLQVEFSGVYEYRLPNGEPMSNVGEGNGIARIEGDTATFRPEGAEDECSITMRFTRGRLVVTQAAAPASCGFGHNVSAGGTYHRTSARRPRFGEFVRTSCSSRS
jgi:hypothetical protein